MTLSSDIESLEEQLQALPKLGVEVLTARNGAMFLVDLIIVGAVKRSLSLGYGLIAMVEARNMICARAIVRMQIDTVSRLLAYTYVANPEEMAGKVIGGVPMSKLKSREGELLRDAYLIGRMTESHSWVREVYNRTSGEIHFSEKQLFASVQSNNDEALTIEMVMAPLDEKYPEWSWCEVVTCFHKLNEILGEVLESYAVHKDG